MSDWSHLNPADNHAATASVAYQPQALAALVTRLCSEHGVSASAASRAAGLSVNCVRNIQRCHHRPTPETLAAITNALPIDLADAIELRRLAGFCFGCPVTQAEPATSPLIIPWLEVNSGNQTEIDNCVAGAEHWRHVTDTILVSTVPGRESLYTDLRDRMPYMRIIPGIKSNDILGGGNFDSVVGWQQIGASAEKAINATGESTVLLEHESALRGYWKGEYEIDFDRLRKGLSCLPDNVRILWYPTLLANDAQRSRCIPLMKAAQAVIDCRLVDLTVCDPHRNSPTAKQALANLAQRDPVPIMYVGRLGSVTYWDYARITDMLELTKERPEILVYPGQTNWVLAAESIVEALRQRRAMGLRP